MIDTALTEQLNRGYVCAADSGPAWKTACDYGFDMSLVDSALSKSPEQRLRQHQFLLDRLLDLNPELGIDAVERNTEFVK